jgi:hypothetical protein
MNSRAYAAGFNFRGATSEAREWAASAIASTSRGC